MKKRVFSVMFVVSFLFFIVAGCSDSEDSDNEPAGDNETGDTDIVEQEENLPDENFSAVTTLSAIITPEVDLTNDLCPEDETAYCDNPAASMQALSPYYSVQMGEWSYTAGEDFSQIDAFTSNASEPTTRTSLFSFAHLSDTHITDEESPSRNAVMDNPVSPGAFRPMDMYTEVVLNAAVKTINYFHSKHPFDFLAITGDFSDSVLNTEVTALTEILTGDIVHPDSGEDDDPVPGENNDPQDDFKAEGVASDLPWIAALGNHDSCMMGTSPIDDSSVDMATGNQANFGTRHGGTYEVVSGEVPADPERRPLFHAELMEHLFQTPGIPEGHGFSQDNIDNDQGYFVYDPEGDIPLRFIMLDTAYRPKPNGFTGMLEYSGGVLDRKQFDEFLAPELDRALEDKRLVIVMSHHALSSIDNDNLPDLYATGSEIADLLVEYENVALYVAGHSHKHRVQFHENDLQTGGFYEVQTTSLIDWPQQFRFFELVRNDNATLSIFSVVVDYEAAEDSLPAMSRKLSLIDTQSGWGEKKDSDLTDRNVELIWPIPESMQTTIEGWPSASDSVAAETTWKEDWE